MADDFTQDELAAICREFQAVGAGYVQAITMATDARLEGAELCASIVQKCRDRIGPASQTCEKKEEDESK